MNQPLIAKVAVPGPFLFPLDYLLNHDDLLADSQSKAVVGGRVWVPFRNKKIVGLVMAIAEQADYELNKIKAISGVIDEEPLFSEQQLGLLTWASHYYHEPIGDVVVSALPKRLRAGENAEINGMQYWRLSAEGQTKNSDDISKRALRQKQLFELLKNSELRSESELNEQLENWRSAAKTLTEKGWLTTTNGPCLRETDYPEAPNHTLNVEQQNAVDEVVNSQLIDGDYQQKFVAFLLEGITGSGKTEVYLGMIDAMLQQGKQVLVLVPEIGLTPQMVSRFEAYLQTRVAALHSGLNDSERHCAWHLIRTGKIKVLLGTRSAIFTPFQNLGLCIIDEEHDLSYKQQEGFRYSARDLIVQRAYREKVPVVLGSATPSLETLHNAKTGRYQLLELKQRAGKAKLPSLKLLDVRGEKVQEGVSRPLKVVMQQHLDKQGQVLLFLNRRGFAPVLMCHDCGWQAACPSCDANMTYHQTDSTNDFGYLQCHHCDEQINKPSCCPSCESEEFVKVGQGTERLEETIKEWFSDKKILRIDRDTTRLKGSMAELTGQAQRGEADILIGTQMLAKGHHFPNVTLVGLLDVDQGLFSADYRASERMAQLILQVSGRAGRAEKAGEVLIQTHHPDHPLLTTLIKQGYSEFATKALAERQMAKLPPYQYQILVRAEATNPNDGMAFLHSLKAGLENLWQQQAKSKETKIEFWGPVSAPMLRRQGRFRYQLMVQSQSRAELHKLLSEMQPHIYASPLTRKVRWSIDVDPQEMY